MNKYIPQVVYPAIVHNMAILNEYQLFTGSNVVKNAFITAPDRIEVTLNEGYNLSDINWELKSYDYSSLDETGVFNENTETQPFFVADGNKLTADNFPLDLHKNYILYGNGQKCPVFLHPAVGGILDTYFDASDFQGLGVTYYGKDAVFRLWSPPAARVELVLFDKNEAVISTPAPLLLNPADKGLWTLELTPALAGVTTLDGLYYQYKVYAYGAARMALDPYALSMAPFGTSSADNIGKGAIININDARVRPTSVIVPFSNNSIMASETDMIAYEIHVRDFTIQPEIFEPDVAGTFKGFNIKTDYLKELGITHVQLMPVNNFYTVNETDRDYRKGSAPVSNYNWGYDPHNYFSLEGWLCTDARNPYSRMYEYAELVQNLHKKGIGVIMDVVYNHTYIAETFENVAPGCYLRHKNDFSISGHSGAGPSVETRHKMARKLIVESLIHFVKTYKVDGFRFDLMGFMDHTTMEIIRKEVGKAYNPTNINDLILQGEAWVFSDIETDVNAQGSDAATTKVNHPENDIKIAFFNDSSRDSYTGRGPQKGFVQGVYKEYDRVATGIIGGLKSYKPIPSALNNEVFNDSYNRFADRPSTCLNYLSIHDGLTLWDKLNLSVDDNSKIERARLMRLASAMLFTSQGKIIIHGGDEILRTKPLSAIDKESHRALTSELINEEEGTKFFHENTYCSNDYTNMIRWDRLSNEYYEFSTQMLAYYKGLISMRRHLPCLRYVNAESINKGLSFVGKSLEYVSDNAFISFSDDSLKTLTITFINGPAYERYYLAGELYPSGTEANFENEGMYFVDFDGQGSGKVSFSREQISNFDLHKWGEASGLNFKLIKTPGQWDAIPEVYTEMGHNILKISAVDNKGMALINLSKVNYIAEATPRPYDKYIAYILDNTLENNMAKPFKETGYTKIIVVHNTDDESAMVEFPIIENMSGWVVIADSYNAGIKPLKYSTSPNYKKFETDVLIGNGVLTVPRKSSAVIAKLK